MYSIAYLSKFHLPGFVLPITVPQFGMEVFYTPLILSIKKGKTTQVFKRSNQKTNNDYCFSIILNNKTLDLEAFNKGQRKVWLPGLSA